MAAELMMGLSAFKGMLDIAKGLKDINDAAARNAVAIELQEKILSAQAQQASLIEQVSQLEKEVAGLKTWDAEKKRYELKGIAWGTVAYMLKPEARASEPPHWACQNCYSDGKIKIFQNTFPKNVKHGGLGWYCPSCDTSINPRNAPKWIDGEGEK